METLRIALVELSTHTKPSGGFIALLNLARALSDRGHEVHVVLGTGNEREQCGYSAISERLEELRSFVHLHMVTGYSDILEVPKLMGTIPKRLRNLDDVYKFDILHSQGLTGLFTPSALRNRLVVTLHGNNIYRGITLLKYVAKGLPMSHGVSGFIDDTIGSFIYWYLEKQACEKAKRVISLTNNEAYLAEKYYGLPRNKLRVVPNPVSLPQCNGNYDLAFPKDSKVLLTVSSLTLIKGIPLIVQASQHILQKNSKSVHVFVGSGPLVETVRRLISKFPNRVVLLAPVSNEITSLYYGSTLLIHGSLYESQGLVIAEAMLAGKPVVAFNVASIPECILHGVTGYLANPFDPEDLADKALAILENEERAKKMGLTGKRRAKNLYNLTFIAEKMEKVYKEVLIN